MNKWLDRLKQNQYCRKEPPKLTEPPTRQVLAVLTGHSEQAKTWDYLLFDDPEERAAIMEYDGGLTREEAECRAGLWN